MEFINKMIETDGKNYHAWSYRQWLVEKYQLWSDELVDVARLIGEDVRNNSAWNQRFFVISRRGSPVDESVLQAEAEYAMKMIVLAPNNESPWNYLQG